MEKNQVYLFPTKNRTVKPEGMHGAYFREFVRLMLCHAWFTGMLETELWCDIPDIAEAAMLHDIGKTVLPKRLVKKKGRLTTEEYEEMQQHTVLGVLCVDQIIPELKDEVIFEYAQKICFQHHERINGRGYPRGLCGDEIPVYVQIVSLADVYDALRTDRSYRKAFPHDKAAKMIFSEECGAFDPDLFDSFEPLLNEFWTLAQMLSGHPAQTECQS